MAFLGFFSLALDTIIVQVEIGRLIDSRESFDQERFVGIIKVLNEECHGLTSLVRRLAWAPGLFSTWIYTFILFDTMSDTVGINQGYLIAFIGLCIALSFKGLKRLNLLYKKKAAKRDTLIAREPLDHRVAADEEVTKPRESAIVNTQENPMIEMQKLSVES